MVEPTVSAIEEEIKELEAEKARLTGATKKPELPSAYQGVAKKGAETPATSPTTPSPTEGFTPITAHKLPQPWKAVPTSVTLPEAEGFYMKDGKYYQKTKYASYEIVPA